MACCQINHMNIVSYPCSVRCGIVISEDTQTFQFAHSHLSNVRYQVVGNSLGIFTDKAAFMGPDRIKIPEQNYIPFRIAYMQVRENLFQHSFGLPVWIGDLTLGALFCYGNKCRIAVYSSGGAEDNILTAVVSHYIAQQQGSSNIIVIIFQRLGHGFSHRF